MDEKTMECADMIMALVANTFALCNLVLGERENYVFLCLITQNILCFSHFHTIEHECTLSLPNGHTLLPQKSHSTNPLIA